MGFLSSDSEHPGPFLTLRTPNTPLAFLSLADRLSLLSALGIFSPTLSSDWDGVPATICLLRVGETDWVPGKAATLG